VTLSSSLAIYQVENAVKVMDALSAYLNGRYDALVELCADDVVWRSVAEPQHAAFGGTFRGRSEVQRYFEILFSTYQISQPRVLDVIPAGDEVLHVLQLDAEKRDGTASGGAFIVGRWRFKHGKAVFYTDYFDVSAALHTSAHGPISPSELVTRDPSFAIYETENAVNVSLGLAAYRGGRIGPIMEMLHPDIAWRSLSEPQHAKFGGLFRGHDAVKTYFRRLAEALVLDEYIVRDVIPAGPEVIHVAEVRAHSVDDPARTVFVRLVCFWRFEAGLVTSLTEYFDVPAYLAQLRGR
jgi:ketosteroid isomerase-like protein